ncbi:MAG: TetR/AcrR family transcriptional regulator [Steroidobacteraceae bacterium]|nr:TetR/AcrR family transcriptional regulator [Steroidobacteraceae bacterium]
MAGKRSQPHESRRDEIIRESAALFERVGYHRASMQMVADAVKLGKPTLYHYFRSKSEILYSIHENLIGDLRDRQQKRIEENLPPNEQLLGVCSDILHQIDEHPGYVRAFIEHHDELDEVHKKQMRKQRQEYLDMVCGILVAGAKAGLFAKYEPRLTALGFLGMCNWAYTWFPQEQNRSVEKTAQALCKVFLDGLNKR